MAGKSRRGARKPHLSAWVPYLVLSAYAWVCVTVVPEANWRSNWDSGILLLLARSLAEGAGYVYLDEPFFLRPPGMPFLLSLIIGDGPFDFEGLNRFVMATAALTALAVYLAMKRLHGPWVALAIALLTATSPIFVGSFNWILTEFPFMAVFFLGLWLVDSEPKGAARSWLSALAGGLLLAAAVSLRSVGLLILPGLVLLDLHRRRRPHSGRCTAAALLVLVLLVPWFLFVREAAGVATRPAEQRLQFDYANAMFRTDPGDPDSPRYDALDLLGRIPGNAARIGAVLGGSVLSSPGALGVGSLAALVLCGFAIALRRRPSMLEWFAVSYSALLLTMPVLLEEVPAVPPRLVLPLLPVIYAYLVTAAVAGVSAIARRSTPLGLGAGLLLLYPLVLHLYTLPARLDASRSSELSGRPFAALWWRERRAASWLRRNTESEAVVLASSAPQLSVLSGRRVVTNRFQRGPGLIERWGVDFVVCDSATGDAYEGRIRARASERWRLRVANGEESIRIYRVGRGSRSPTEGPSS